MNSSDADRQIKQMVNFILQEAQEKANEIRIKTEHDFNLEKQMLVHNAKVKIQEEYARKEREREINKRIARSAEIGASRRKKMIAREELLQSLITEGKARCGEVAQHEGAYRTLLRDLSVQGLIKLHETEVMLAVRSKDVHMIESLVPEIAANYAAIMKQEAGVDMHTKLTVCKDEKLMPPSHSAGGVTLVAKNGKIVCDNTLDTRLMTVNYDEKPTIRKMLFPEIK
ncbi:ATP synthase subunit [Saprolegnia parasitica CBS 223.65]|uniref:ATP synthase subunit n=1 Tax=Saprolegnia parasitica (strain CBS 223.65) TaxID=695850 RepID=A0A067C1S9_SAPPC|nr:ATP synthase subunit [Saprolegnia parasitica CBS 223.65]KDO20737.1 ATP synthase subunit [Saprolegnia parasitica CBS 223.65]|eukprot:XP_012208549.1 ATP synthase subunit [Saprolegnia parasitica CBS 223.65]